MTEINDLFLQTATLCTEFAGEITEAVESVNQVRAYAEKVRLKAEKGTADLRKSIDAIEALMTSAGQEMAQARQRAETGVDALVAKASSTGTEMTSLVAAVKKGTSELEAKKAALLSSIQKQRDVAVEDFEGRQQDLQDLGTTAQETFKQAETALAAFRETADTARAELDQKMFDWQKAVEELATGTARSADGWVDKLEALLKSAVGRMVDEGDDMVTKHNTSMTALKTEFITKAPKEMDTSLEALVEQLSGVVDAIDNCKAVLPPKAAEIAAKVNGLLAVIESACTSMNDADRL